MDHFTLAVIIGDIVMTAAFVALIVVDKGRPATAPIEPVKTGKRPA